MPDIDRAEPRTHGLTQFFTEEPLLVKVIIVNGGLTVPQGYVAVLTAPVKGDIIPFATQFMDQRNEATVMSVEYNPVRRTDNLGYHYTAYCHI